MWGRFLIAANTWMKLRDMRKLSVVIICLQLQWKSTGAGTMQRPATRANFLLITF